MKNKNSGNSSEKKKRLPGRRGSLLGLPSPLSNMTTSPSSSSTNNPASTTSPIISNNSTTLKEMDLLSSSSSDDGRMTLTMTLPSGRLNFSVLPLHKSHGKFSGGLLITNNRRDDGRIRDGDVIIEVNGIDLRHLDFDGAVDVLSRQGERSCVFERGGQPEERWESNIISIYEERINMLLSSGDESRKEIREATLRFEKAVGFLNDNITRIESCEREVGECKLDVNTLYELLSERHQQCQKEDNVEEDAPQRVDAVAERQKAEDVVELKAEPQTDSAPPRSRKLC